ncbi:hypothetical protein Tco_1388999, partial [Tanacetum coccineum]
YRTLAMIGALEKDKVQSGDVSAIDKVSYAFLILIKLKVVMRHHICNRKRGNWMAPEVLSDEASNEKLSLWEGVTMAEKDAIGKMSTHTCRIVNLDDGHGYEQLNRGCVLWEPFKLQIFYLQKVLRSMQLIYTDISHKRNADSRGRRCLIESMVFSMAMQASWSDSTSAKQSLDMEKVRFMLSF